MPQEAKRMWQASPTNLNCSRELPKSQGLPSPPGIPQAGVKICHWCRASCATPIPNSRSRTQVRILTGFARLRFMVSSGSSEIAVHIAPGAQPRDILQIVLQRSPMLRAAGVVLGTRVRSSSSHASSPRGPALADPVTCAEPRIDIPQGWHRIADGTLA